MATAHESEEESLSDGESYVSNESDSESDGSDGENDSQSPVREPCRYYNKGGCRDGARCSYLHVCRYALTGNCRYGTEFPQLTDGRYHQWQLNDGRGWKSIDNDHIIEAQYCLPHSKSIKIYNTPYGAVSIDFNRMKVYGKDLKVRRLDDGNTVWLWYCTLRRKWHKYGEKDSRGNTNPVKCSDIERKFQSNPKSSFTFNIGSETLEIKFREMRQVGQNRKRKVTRRPSYRPQQAAAGSGWPACIFTAITATSSVNRLYHHCAALLLTIVSQVAAALSNVSLGTKPKWQFEGNSSAWHDYRPRTECSVTSEDIERKYQQNPNGSMVFKVNGHSYKLDFGEMKQINLKTQRSRKIQRVLV
ncbi:uncharacterized protein si:ch211-244b2.4 [Acanthopagrus latus]|uniref:uncharacterized protein si:ch211-244b2.4 n=1 Tax=Acanthopagrus latus TaxID=8177 RepID=UPI00187C9513|nr:uncharacterized protein si:ch211-244b2.4 [Acanthopagrus latus]